MDSDSQVVDNEVLPPEKKSYILRNPPNINYSDKRATWRSMGWNNIIVVSNKLHIVAKSCANVVDYISNYVKPTPPTNIVTNDTILNQYIIKHGLKVFGNNGEAGVQKELQQFHDHIFVKPKNPQDLSYEQRISSLSYMIFLKLKSYKVTIKGRRFKYGRKHQNWLSKEDISSPNVSTEGLMLLCMIDTMEGQELATANIPGAFL